MPSRNPKATNNFRRDKNVLRCLDKIAFRIPQESEAFARNFDDAVAKFRFALQLAILGALTADRVGCSD